MELSNYGFVEVGRWELKESLKSGIAFKLCPGLESERVIYAFVVDNKVKYIGICENTNTTLKDRMGRYKNMQGGSTNKRIAREIKDCLDREETVKIFALKPESPLQYKGLNVDLVKGLENPLVEKFKPAWNIQNRG